LKISLITGDEPHYQVGLVSGLAKQDLLLEVIGGDKLAEAPVMREPRVRFRNLRGHLDPKRPAWQKLVQVIRYYLRLMLYAARTDSGLIHVQWPYKFPFFDRTILNLWYKIWRKKIVFTAHNVDQGARDGKRSWKNTLTLRFQYWIVDHIIVHTTKMKAQLVLDFAVANAKISVIPHGINSAVPETSMSPAEARRALNLEPDERVLLFFGLIDRYKGLEYLVKALAQLKRQGKRFRLVIAGRIKECPTYWSEIDGLIQGGDLKDDVVAHLRHIPDESVELYFKAADALAMPYRSIFQSGVLFLAYAFGLPVIATDVGCLKDDVVEGKTGLLCRSDDAEDLAEKIGKYFDSDLYQHLADRRREIRDYAFEHYSWSRIGALTQKVYEHVQGKGPVAIKNPASNEVGVTDIQRVK
jgi:glycosyltransferase involved in cell wall biosynthesis